MSQKLTGREAVIALMEGKTVFRSGVYKGQPFRNELSLEGRLIYCVHDNDPADKKVWELINALSFDDWEIVPEPMVWEGEHLVTQFDKTDESLGGIIRLNANFIGKRVKVRIEEIPE